jgi:hypothetical protein
MASLNGTFDATEVAPAVPLEVLPPGKYLAQLIESEMAPTKAGDGQLLKLIFEILEGPSARRKIFDQLNLVNRNEQTVEIAQRTLSATLGRHSDPSEDEITIAERALLEKNLSGWLAIMEGDPWGGSPPRLLEVRPLASPTSSFSDAADACIVNILAKRDEVKE